jgi:hypothetical protein
VERVIYGKAWTSQVTKKELSGALIKCLQNNFTGF